MMHFGVRFIDSEAADQGRAVLEELVANSTLFVTELRSEGIISDLFEDDVSVDDFDATFSSIVLDDYVDISAVIRKFSSYLL